MKCLKCGYEPPKGRPKFRRQENKMKTLMEMKEEMNTLLNSESWHNGNGITGRAVDGLRTEIAQEERKLRQGCRCTSHDSGDCDACMELYA